MPGDSTKPVGPTLTIKPGPSPVPTFTVDSKPNNVSLEIGPDDDDVNVTGNKDDSVSAATEIIVEGDLAIRLQKLSPTSTTPEWQVSLIACS